MSRTRRNTLNRTKLMLIVIRNKQYKISLQYSCRIGMTKTEIVIAQILKIAPKGKQKCFKIPYCHTKYVYINSFV